MEQLMKIPSWIPALLLGLSSASIHADEDLASYLGRFDYDERVQMKISSPDLVKLLMGGKAQLIDIRFKEEYAAWHMGMAKNIPLNELPKRLNELDKDKLIVTACPHKDRAVMARTFLTLKGYRSEYLEDGLVGLAEYLRGDRAYDFITQTQRP